MSRRAIKRRLLGRELALHGRPLPDFTGMTAAQILLWAAGHGEYETVVELAAEGHQPKMVTPEEREAALRSAGQWPTEDAAPSPQAVSDSPPAAAAEPGTPMAKTPGQLYADEKCQWRLRTAADDAEDADPFAGYRIEVDYDPLEGM
jgi:hypothetical protein